MTGPTDFARIPIHGVWIGFRVEAADKNCCDAKPDQMHDPAASETAAIRFNDRQKEGRGCRKDESAALHQGSQRAGTGRVRQMVQCNNQAERKTARESDTAQGNPEDGQQQRCAGEAKETRDLKGDADPEPGTSIGAFPRQKWKQDRSNPLADRHDRDQKAAVAAAPAVRLVIGCKPGDHG